MERIAILFPQQQSALSTVACIIGTVEVFTKASEYWEKQGNKQKYELIIAGTATKEEFVKGLVAIKADAHISTIEKAKLIIIPAALPQKENSENVEMLDWIKKQYKVGAEVASMCSGAFILAETGILDGRSCSTHWSMADKFKEMFPKVDLLTDKLITDEKGIYTNGGAYSFLNLVIYLVEKYYDRQTAIYCSKILQIEIDRISQSPFSIFTGQKTHDDNVVLDAQDFIEKNYSGKISIELLSAKFNVGRRNFDRRFVKATGVTPLDYLQRVKIEVAKKSLENTRKTVNEVMCDVGYNDTKAFREVFGRITGMSPLDYKSKYNKS
ncbi:MAG: helix-turn-helix domain-containing protein [Chitinophagaceae bacterium]